MTKEIVPTFRKAYPPLPAEHMRLIGEICTYWTAIEAVVLQAVCESTNIGEYEGRYLGGHVPFGTRIDMLTAVAATLKEDAENKDKGQQLGKSIERVRQAYQLRCKYAHARLRSNGPENDPDLHYERVTKKIEIGSRPLTLTEIVADANEIYESCEAFVHFLQTHGLCKQSWQ